jgi:hypothetical protein
MEMCTIRDLHAHKIQHELLCQAVKFQYFYSLTSLRCLTILAWVTLRLLDLGDVGRLGFEFSDEAAFLFAVADVA